MSVKVSSYVWEHTTAKGSALLLLLAIADYCHDDGQGAWPSVPTLAAKARISARSVQYHTRRLVADGLLVLQDGAGPNGVHTYCIPVPWGANYSEGCKPCRGANFAPVQITASAQIGGGANPAPKPLLTVIKDPTYLIENDCKENVNGGDDERPAAEVWSAVAGELQLELPKSSFNTWFRGASEVSYEHGVLVVAVRNTFVLEWLRRRLWANVDRAAAHQRVKVRFVVGAGWAGALPPAKEALDGNAQATIRGQA